MSGWYGYEDVVAHDAVVNGATADTAIGQGHGAGRNASENTWHGEFSSERSGRAARVGPRSHFARLSYLHG
jgi:hypothetical protein